jgi:DNA-binding MurR/RpiR family transcriptional regulator
MTTALVYGIAISGEAVARADNGDSAVAMATVGGGNGTTGSDLWRCKSEAEEETRLINPPEAVRAVAEAIGNAGKVFIIGFGEDDLHARAFAWRLSLLGIPTIHNFDAAHMTASVSAASAGDVLLVFCEDGTQTALSQICHQFRKVKGKVITVTRHTSNALRAHADLALLVSAHDDRPHIEPLLYRSALQHLLDGIFVMLCENSKKRFGILQENLERIQPVLKP